MYYCRCEHFVMTYCKVKYRTQVFKNSQHFKFKSLAADLPSDLLYSDLSGKNVKGEIPLELNNMQDLTEL